jgi:diaminohydroxyphosphoribosylaminopyrimidine deaminase/5-amino-6-(5-phosphoribosylamino)uracil reductase
LYAGPELLLVAGFFMMDDIRYMRRALALARRGAGWVNPNPMVGAVVVKDNRIIGEGYHEYFGGQHAEINAILKASESVEGSTLYSTLEPCNHQGKTPPCTQRILESKITKVVIGLMDPNPSVEGHGTEFLKSHGIEVTSGVLADEISVLNEIFLKFVTQRKPFVLLKSAMTLDGKIATVANASRWITGSSSREKVHRLRQELSSVLIGVNSVIVDDPMLNVRLDGKKWRNPFKIIADTHARIPLTAKVLSHEPQLTILATSSLAPEEKINRLKRLGVQVLNCPLMDDRIDLNWLMGALAAMDIDSVMIEGGSTLAFSALKSGIVDKIINFIAPKLLGGKAAPSPLGGEGIASMNEAVRVRNWKMQKLGEDFVVEGYVGG